MPFSQLVGAKTLFVHGVTYLVILHHPGTEARRAPVNIYTFQELVYEE